MPLDPNIALQVQRYRAPDQMGQLNQLMAIQQTQRANALQDYQMQKDMREDQLKTAYRNALQGAVGPDGTLNYDALKAAAVQSGDVATAMDVDKNIAGTNTLKAQGQLANLKIAKERIDVTSRILAGAKDTPTYRPALQKLGEIFGPEAIAGAPDDYDAAWVKSQIDAGMSAKEHVDAEMKRQGFEENKRSNKVKEKAALLRAQNTGALVEIYDPSSPTGTKFVPRDQAIGQPGKPPSSMEITTADGTVIRQGRASGTGGLEKSTKGAVEKEAIKSADMLSQVRKIRQEFDPQYYALPEQARNAARGLRAKFDPSSLQGQELSDYKKFRSYSANIGRTQAQQINDLYGAALSGTEAKRAKTFIVNESDDAITADEKLRAYEELMTLATAKNSYILQNGLSAEEISVDRMPDIMRKRGDQIEQELSRSGIAGPQINAAVRQQLRSEFGLP
jgi:hypothetical protein